MNFSIQILGSNSALPTFKRFSTAQIITINNKPYLIDCAEGTQIQMRRFNSSFGKISNIFISHLHGDHYYGLFGLLSSYNLNRRKTPINIFADPFLEKMFRSEFSPLNLNELTYKINFFPLSDEYNQIFEDKDLLVYSFPLLHRIKSWGFLFLEKEKQFNIKKDAIIKFNLSIDQIKSIKNGDDLFIDNQIIPNSELTHQHFLPRSYAFCSDTAYYEIITQYIQNVDLLYHEATFCDDSFQKAETVYHSTASQAAKIAKLANAKKLLIGHFSPSIPSPEKSLNEAKLHFNDAIAAKDGMQIEVTKEHNFVITE